MLIVYSLYSGFHKRRLRVLTLILIHGAGGGRMSWQLQLRHFKEARAVELPGHPEGSGYGSIVEYVDWLEDFLKRSAIKDPILVGHSMGGAIAIDYALRNIDLEGLVLVGTGARLRVRQDILQEILENYEEASKLIARLSVSPQCDAIVAERIARMMLNVSAKVTHDDFSACNAFDRMNDVEKINTRTLIVCGADDQLTPPKYSQYLHDKIRNSELVLIPGAGHSVMLEKHREFNQSLEVFLSSLRASGREA
jgi:pimeloyl-ACP methyl ester carboxylesterase